ncbi:hypothetical protein Y1Q_0021092 [Alligator mississippiensis]|uniref:Uncharacterized protein n=1 Tax=Alligator mississippiensis TaxID=8496 RepID=A0A151NRF3_ALLMI|nr:hypothetical protein Y1Q_0021092 [Alligator mississippiensis]
MKQLLCIIADRSVLREDLHGMDDNKVTEDAEAGKEEDAAVQVEVEAKVDKLTHEVSKDPMLSIGIVMYQEWKAG